ncbi:MAG TPA: hypothetical protein VIF62_39035, partial [Labilithrix sp.]
MKRAALACVLLASCRNCDDAPAVQPPVAVFDAAPPKPSARQSLSDGAPQPATKVEIRNRREYLLALEKGRKATQGKDWTNAIGAFDEAIKADRHDARAYAERGYVHLLAGDDLVAASADFDHASALTKDPALLAQIWFNRGLLDEKSGDEKSALFDFRVANELAPSA